MVIGPPLRRFLDAGRARLHRQCVSGWMVVAFYVAEALVYVLGLRWIARAWLSERWSARRVAIAAGLLTVLLVGLPIMLSAAQGAAQWIVVLVVLVVLAGYLVAVNVAMWGYAERHGVRDELRRLYDKDRLH